MHKQGKAYTMRERNMEKSISLKDKQPPASAGESLEFTLSKRAYSNLNLKLTLKTLIKALMNDKLSSKSKQLCLKIQNRL